MDEATQVSVRQSLMDMGFPDDIIGVALASTSSEEEAVNLALSFMENDKPAPLPPFTAPKPVEVPPITGELSMAYIVRKDLGMSLGKMGAQVGHAGRLISHVFAYGRRTKETSLCPSLHARSDELYCLRRRE